jgi:hypothetical protein
MAIIRIVNVRSKIMETVLDKTTIAAFLRTSALALGVDPGSARRAMQESIDYPRPNPRAQAVCARERVSTLAR